MTLKNICSIGMLLVLAGSVNAKNMHKVFGTSDKIIKGSAKIELYVIDPIPVMSVDQVQGELYVYDYKVISTLKLSKRGGAMVAIAALDTNQYLYGVNKKCPFMGKYAVHFRQGKSSMTIILSAEPCGKAIIFCPGTIIDKKHIDLVENNRIVAAVEKLLKPKNTVENKKE